jgi:hypothetical protein
MLRLVGGHANDLRRVFAREENSRRYMGVRPGGGSRIDVYCRQRQKTEGRNRDVRAHIRINLFTN